MLTLGLWANSIRVGVPGLRERACGCDIVDSLTGETGRSLLQNEQPDTTLEDVQRECIFEYISVQAEMCVCVYLVDSCTVLIRTPARDNITLPWIRFWRKENASNVKRQSHVRKHKGEKERETDDKISFRRLFFFSGKLTRRRRRRRRTDDCYLRF